MSNNYILREKLEDEAHGIDDEENQREEKINNNKRQKKRKKRKNKRSFPLMYFTFP